MPTLLKSIHLVEMVSQVLSLRKITYIVTRSIDMQFIIRLLKQLGCFLNTVFKWSHLVS